MNVTKHHFIILENKNDLFYFLGGKPGIVASFFLFLLLPFNRPFLAFPKTIGLSPVTSSYRKNTKRESGPQKFSILFTKEEQQVVRRRRERKRSTQTDRQIDRSTKKEIEQKRAKSNTLK